MKKQVIIFLVLYFSIFSIIDAQAAYLKNIPTTEIKDWDVKDRSDEHNKGNFNSIAIFISFADDTVFTHTYSSINNMFNDESQNTNSLINYFKSASYNTLTVRTFFYPSPNNNVIVSYHDIHPKRYYKPNDESNTNPDGYSNKTEKDERETGLLERAITYIKANYPVPNELIIDHDGDGKVDNVFFIVKSDLSGDILYPHHYKLNNVTITINEKRVWDYVILPTDDTYYFKISTACHEFNHALGAPDLYHDDIIGGPNPVGGWDLMCDYTTPPQHCGAWMKFLYGGWSVYITPITQAGTYTLNPISSPTTDKIAYQIPSSDPNQIYVLEYRSKNTPFESALAGSGLLIYRIDKNSHGNYDYNPSINKYDEVYIFRPGGSFNSEGDIENAFFSLDENRTEFSPSTDPRPFLSDGTVDNSFRIYDISSAGSTISFKYEPLYTITATANPTAGGTINGAGFYGENTECTLTAIPNAHFTFTNWTKDGVIVSTSPTYSFTVTENAEYVANFNSTPWRGIQCVSHGHGSVSVVSPITYYGGYLVGYEGDVITIEAIPSGGWSLSELKVFDFDGNNITVTNNQFIMPNKSVEVIATFNQGIEVNIDDFRYRLNDITLTAEIYGHKTNTDIFHNPNYGCLDIPSSVVYEGQIYEVTSIGFPSTDGYNWIGFTSLMIPNSVTSIEEAAFRGCGGFTGELLIPNSVIRIGSNAFRGCRGFTGNLVIPNSVKVIGNESFKDCDGFSGSLSIGNSVTMIGQWAFAGCDGFSTVSFGNSVRRIYDYAFLDCSGLTSVYYSGEISQWCDVDFDNVGSNPLEYANNLFINGVLLTDLIIPETITGINENAFSGGTCITTLVIPTPVTYIGRCAFDNCIGLTSLTIGNFITSIGDYAFRNCTNLTSVEFPNSVTSIGERAFYDCSGLAGTLTIPNSVTNIGYGAFNGCTGLNSVRMHCTTPPEISSNCFSFDGVDYSIPVFVPCGTKNAYKAAEYWSEFENIYESPYNLVITSNDDLGGEISVLEYADCEDNHCAILAVPNIGYNFLGWYVDDYFTTITPFCDFTLTEDVTFEARFEMLPDHNVANGTSYLWSDPGTWFLGEVPTSTSTVGIRQDVLVDVDAEVSAVGIYDGSNITVMPGVTLTVADTLGSAENSSIIIQDGGQLVHSNEEAKATILKSIEPYTSDDDGWNLISFPLVGNGDLSAIENMLSSQYDLYAYDEPTAVWKNQKYDSNNFTSIEAGVGYLYANKGKATDIVPVGEQIGEGTSTLDYTPFFTLYNYSIAENLFLASELLTAGLSTTPIGALYWYATNETGYLQSNLSIWMANVSDAELTTTSHNVSEMTLVYTDNMTPVTGWNPFVFNENSFAWDGVSNLLVCVQRNNGAWNSTINWQAHNPGFTATSYKYNDDNAYDMTTETYPMSVSSSLRPNTFFQTTDQVGQQFVNYQPITMSFAGELENGTAEVTVPLSYTEGITLAGFNLVGNPFVHNVTSYTGTNVADGCFRLNDTRDDLIVSEISASNPLKPVEGFFVKATAADASITFNHQTRGEKSKEGVINLELSADGKIIDRLLVRNDGNPLEKLSLGHGKARLFVVKDRLEMAAVPMEGNEQPIYFKTVKNGSYTIKVYLEGMELNYLHLIDHKTGANVDLLVDPSYSFEARNSDYESRFQLVYSPKIASDADDEPFAFISNGNIILMGEHSNATLQIVDMTGRLVYSQEGHIQSVPTEGMASGVYVLRLINGNETRIQKIVIK